MAESELAPPAAKKATSGRHASALQKEELVAFLERQPDLARPRGELSGCFTGHEREKMWAQLAEHLNECGPAKKSATMWRRYWSELVAKIKRDAAVASEAATGTGGGKLPGLGGWVLSLIDRECAVGLGPSLLLKGPTSQNTLRLEALNHLVTVSERQARAVESVAEVQRAALQQQYRCPRCSPVEPPEDTL
ncbi:hypothetical protein HPB49_012539 [Dermacentor silvarum]|uniref:Uncharacterized protein n=1 Tax=Dermacentor silvarum TaxID=543639 RepID=A0ACB8DD93_DERSI|nr:hypothetical protein HPB49_012539 [Dermacentor silvarum]